MSMLAEKKRKAKWIVNPTKKPLWTTDSNGIKFGKELMEKMGWSAGKGLGVNEQGIQEPLKVSYKNDTKGMGFKGNDQDWIEHQDEFNSFLLQLRNSDESSVVKTSNAEENQIKSLEEKSKRSKARVHYQKFTRGKDLSRYSENDLACILGNTMKKKKITTEEVVKTESEVDENYETTFGVTTINSGSIQDYFKKKWISHSSNSNVVDVKAAQNFEKNLPNTKSYFPTCEVENIQDEDKKKFSKRKLKHSHEDVNVEESVTFESNSFEKSKNKERKRKKKTEKDVNSEEEPEIKRVKKSKDVLVEVAYGLRSEVKKSEGLLTENENTNSDIVKLNKRTSDEEFSDFIKKTKKKNNEDCSFQVLCGNEKVNDVKEKNDTSNKELKKKKKRGNFEEKKNFQNENQNFSDFQNVRETHVCKSETIDRMSSNGENDCNRELVLKKKKKKAEKEEKEVELGKNCRSNLNKENIKNINETEISPEREIVKKEKIKKNKKEKLVQEEEMEHIESCSSTVKSDVEKVSVKNIIVKEGTSEVDSFKRKNKKKDVKENSVEEDTVENLKNSVSDIIYFCAEGKQTTDEKQVIIGSETIKKKKKKDKLLKEVENCVKSCNGQIVNSYVTEENMKSAKEKDLGVELIKKKMKKKKKLAEKEETESIEDYNIKITKPDQEKAGGENIIEIKVKQEVDLIERKNKKKKKLVEKEEVKNEIKHVSSDHNGKEGESSLEVKKHNFVSEKNAQKTESFEGSNEKEPKKKEIFGNSFGYRVHEEQKEEQVEKSNFERVNNKIGFNKNSKNNFNFNINNSGYNINYNVQKNNRQNYYNVQKNNRQNYYNVNRFNYNYYNYHYNLFSAPQSNKTEKNGVQSHKLEFLNEKTVDKFYPGQNAGERVRRLIHWVNFSEFKGSNIEKLVGYGFQKDFLYDRFT